MGTLFLTVIPHAIVILNIQEILEKISIIPASQSIADLLSKLIKPKRQIDFGRNAPTSKLLSHISCTIDVVWRIIN